MIGRRHEQNWREFSVAGFIISSIQKYFSGRIDLGVPKLDDAQRKSVISLAKEVAGRFGRGVTQFHWLWLFLTASAVAGPCGGQWGRSLPPKDRQTHTRLTALFHGLPGWAGTRKAKPIWILLKQETVSGISWAICKSAPICRQITTPAPHHSVFYRPDALPAAQPTASKHWWQHRSPPKRRPEKYFWTKVEINPATEG